MSWLFPKWAGVLFLVLGSVAAFGGCASSGTSKVVSPETDIDDDANRSEGSMVKRFDLNGDGEADMEKVYKVSPAVAGEGGADTEEKRVLLEKRLDLDYNGTYDVFSYYNDGELVRERIDLDFDGKPDVENIFRGGKLVERRMAPGFDGKYSVWKYYNEEGVLFKKARDTDANSRPDEWEYYRDQQLIRIGFDRDGDGDPEYFEDIKGE